VVGYPRVYFTVAAALGQTPAEIDVFALRLAKVFADFQKALAKAAAGPPERPPAAARGVGAPSADGARDDAGDVPAAPGGAR
jgi:hypothetical protein